MDIDSNLLTLSVHELKKHANQLGLELAGRETREEILLLLMGSSDDASFQQKWLPLKRSIRKSSQDGFTGSWADALDEVIQITLRELRSRTQAKATKTKSRHVESALFCKTLVAVNNVWRNTPGRSVPPSLSLFTNPIALFSFQVHERRYRCLEYSWVNDSQTEEEFNNVISTIAKSYSSKQINVNEDPTTTELLSVLIDHIYEGTQSDSTTVLEDGTCFSEVLRSRRSAILDWQERLEKKVTDTYEHDEDSYNFYSYPIVDLLIRDGRYLIAVFISPLDKNFVDEKTERLHQISEISLGIFDAGDLNYSGLISPTVPLLKQAFGRVLFTNMHEEATRALRETFRDQSAILRHWVRIATEGYEGIVDNKMRKGIFDSEEFCKAIVNNVLCADVPNVDSEIYPFDRVFIFKEAGASYFRDLSQPIEMLVIEAAVLSNNPADRGQFLTSREMRIRGTEEYERDNSQKTITEDHIYRFYIHSHPMGLVFTKRANLSREEILDIDPAAASSLSHRDSDQTLLFIKLPDEREGDISRLLATIMGRLVPGNYRKKEIPSPNSDQVLFEVDTYSEEYEQERLEITQKFDPQGLFFVYDHGLKLAGDIPLLNRLQEAYSSFLQIHYKELDKQHLVDRYKQDNLDEAQMEQILNEHSSLQKENRRDAKRTMRGWNYGRKHDGEQVSKVVATAFSWELHDENTKSLRQQDGPLGQHLKKEEALLGDEYEYTMILVSDNDAEKSLSQLNAERENLKLFFQLIMDRIWIDKKIEHDRLNVRSQMIGSSLVQFAHRAKSLVDKSRSSILDAEIEKLVRLTKPKGTTAEVVTFQSIADYFSYLFDLELVTNGSLEPAFGHIQNWIGLVLESQLEQNQLNLSFNSAKIPPLRVRISKMIVKEAFENALKNACEAALIAPDDASQKYVEVWAEAVPAGPGGEKQDDQWFLDVVIENSGGPIPELLLRELNSPNPQPVSRQKKSGSTGLGVYLSRYELLNDIGSGADLKFSNLNDGIIQTRLRLPAELMNQTQFTSNDLDTDSPTADTGDYILYVEDDAEIAQISLERLRDILVQLPATIIHRSSLSGAVKVMQQRMPLAVFTDFYITPTEYSGSAGKRHGLTLISEILGRSRQNNSPKPPIWVLTREKETDVTRGLEEMGIRLSDFGYRLIPANTTKYDQTSLNGILSVFPGIKHPNDVPEFDSFMEALLGKNVSELRSTSTQPSGKIVEPKVLDINQVSFDEIEMAYEASVGKSENSVLIFSQNSNDIDQLAGYIGKWYSLPALPDPEYHLPYQRKNHMIYDHVWHQRILLVLLLPEEIFSQLSQSFKYWGLSKNIWMATKGDDLGRVAANWISIHHEEKGPLSKMRHDLKNILAGPKIAHYLEPLLVYLDEAENILQASQLDVLDWKSNSFTSDQLADAIIKPAEYKEQNLEANDKLIDVLAHVQDLIARAGETNVNVHSKLKDIRNTIYHLSNYLRDQIR